MSGYVALSFDEGEPDDVWTRILARLQVLQPGLVVESSHIVAALGQAVAGELADLRNLVTNVGAAIFKQWGTSTLGIPILGAVAAQLPVTFTILEDDSVDRVLPGGTAVGWGGAPGGTPADLSFALVDDLPVPAGTTSVSAILAAETPGAAPNAVPAGPLVLLSNLSWVTAVAAASAASGGVDAETDEAYVARLSLTAQTISQNPILPADFAQLATDIPGVARAIAVDGWDPDTGGHNVPRCVGIVPLDVNGLPVSDDISDAVETLLDSMREVNFIVHAGSPTYTTVTVSATILADSPSVVTSAQAAARAAVTAFLNPATWNGPAVRLFDVSRIIGNAPGVTSVLGITINGAVGDLILAGDAPLPAGTVANSNWGTPSVVNISAS